MGRPTHAPKVCSHKGCIHDQPCPTHHHHRSGRRPRQTVRSGWAEQRRAARVIRRHATICQVCGLRGSDEADHVVPLWEGGADDESNMRPIHGRPCHQAKTRTEAARRAAQRGGVPPRSP